MRSKLLLVGALALGMSSTAQAQVEIAGFAGTMVPLNVMLVDTAGGGYFNLTAHTVYGLRIAKAMSPTLGLEFQVGTGQGDLDVVSGGTPLKLPNHVYFADARVRLRLMGTSDYNLNAIGGVGYTKFGDGLFQAAHELDSGTNMEGKVTGIVGLGFRARMGTHTTLTFDATDRIHSQSVVASSLGGLIEKTQHEATVMAGLAFPL